MKRLVYQIFILGVDRVEFFFFASLCAAFVFYPSNFAGMFFSFCITLFFIRKKSGILISFLILLLHLFAANCLLVTDIKSYSGDRYNYATTGGTLISAQELQVGDIVIGNFRLQIYSGEDEGRFARGYNIAEDDGVVFHMPLVGSVLSYRKWLSEKLFDSSGAKLRLTQAVVLGDKKFLETPVKDNFYLTGLGHLLAVSGLHVGLYAMMCYFIFSFLPFKLRLFPAGVMLLLLIPFTGFKVPVLRAGLIGFAVIAAKLLDYKTDLKKILLFFAGIFILISPSMAADPSFLLSFSAVYGLLSMHMIKVRRYLEPFLVGLVATVFIIPAASVSFGSFNVSSIISTPVLIPVLSLQVIVFFIYLIFPSISLEPLILLEKLHLGLVDFFADIFRFMFTLYSTELIWALLAWVFLVLCVRLRVLWMTFFLLLVPYLPANVEDGWYIPNMGRSKGFVVQGRETHIFYKGYHSDFLYGFLPYLAKLGVQKADKGTINIYGADNIFIPIKTESEDYGGICVNESTPDCRAVYHTRSNTYNCNDDKVHVLYKNRCETEKTYLLSKTGDVKIEYKSK
ncbi:MAG: hypothetical protein C0602_05230 [Denitrovibrio sp.]|nr:MAG: hypothetical protein C0602_05230 [Denitrovibrio sp.]